MNFFPSTQWRPARAWNVSVAESRGAVKWCVMDGTRWLVTRRGAKYQTRLASGGLHIRRVVDIGEN